MWPAIVNCSERDVLVRTCNAKRVSYAVLRRNLGLNELLGALQLLVTYANFWQ